MCSRYSITTPAEAMRRIFEAQGSLPNFPPRYNMAPTQQAPIIRAGEGGPECVLARWGLVPSWAKDLKIGSQCINAKAETVATKPAFRSAFKSRRCLVPASGFYEWQKRGKEKQPYWIGMIDKEPFAFAGLWERWRADGETIDTYAIITGEPNELVAPIHDRMPVILTPECHSGWLRSTALEAVSMLVPYPAEWMMAYPISTLVNSPKNDVPEVLAPAL